MKLRSKVLLSVIGGIVALNAVLYVATDAVVMSGFLAEKRDAADRAVQSTREIVHTMVDQFMHYRAAEVSFAKVRITDANPVGRVSPQGYRCQIVKREQAKL